MIDPSEGIYLECGLQMLLPLRALKYPGGQVPTFPAKIKGRSSGTILLTISFLLNHEKGNLNFNAAKEISLALF